MIIFHGTKQIGTQSFMIFTNEDGAFVNIPTDKQTELLFLHHFHRLSPGTNPVDPQNKPPLK